MINVILMGRLGNQMFQFATAYALAKRRRSSVVIDTSNYCNLKTFDQYELWRFGGAGPGRLNKASALWKQTNRRLGFKPSYEPTFLMDGLGFDPRVLDLPDGSCLKGWFQSERYFDDFGRDIKNILCLNEHLPNGASIALKTLRNGRPLTSIHVRRGDYVGNTLFEVDLRNYYSAAINELRRSTGCCFLVISDDIAWCVQQLEFQHRDIYVISDLSLERNTPLADMAIMAACDHHIIANSSFSWWGAWLCGNPEKQVRLPQRWLSGYSAEQCGVVARGWVSV